jgi:intracellular septation protein A
MKKLLPLIIATTAALCLAAYCDYKQPDTVNIAATAILVVIGIITVVMIYKMGGDDEK